MRTKLIASTCILIFMTVMTNPTFAQSTLKGSGGVIKELQSGGLKVKPVPLTTNECMGLGGDVKSDPNCASGSACVTKTSTGTHSVCITSFSVK
jgi:hypothetical protein